MSDNIIDMREAIELLGTSQPTFYRWLREGSVKGHKVGRQWRFQREDIQALARGETPLVEQPKDLESLRAEVMQRLAAAGQVSVGEEDSDPLRAVAILILRLAIAQKASDVHLEATERGGQLRLRIDGEMHLIASHSKDSQRELVAALKGMHHCNVQICDLAQDGRLRAQQDGSTIDCRLTCIPTLFGEDVVLRLLVPEHAYIELDRIGLPPEQREPVDQALASRHGLIIVSGPTGSGKTTTLYALLNQLNEPGRKLVSIEEPIEYCIAGVQQIQARENKLSATHALRAALRWAPDVLMLSQLSSGEQAREACEAALSGHLVLTQLHCDTCLSVIERLRDLQVPAVVLGDALRLVIAQRLVRRVCPRCAEACALPEEEKLLVEEICHDNAIDVATLPQEWRQSKGCEHCNGIGYRGRLAINEVLPVSPDLRRAIMGGADTEALRDIQLVEGQFDLRGEALMRAAKGETTLFELRRMRSF